jgi:starch-binding outer membrane protein, SusD/RagB family
MVKIIINILAISMLAVSCSEDYLETYPTNQISDKEIFQTAEGAQTVLDGVLRDMRSHHGVETMHDQFGVKSIDLASDLMGEDIVVEKFHWFGADYRFENHGAKGYRSIYAWTLFYRIIYNVNAIINNIEEASSESDNVRKGLKAQALALRAYSYFQLIQLYQHTYSGHENDPGVPIYTDASISGNPRSKVSEVYQQIITDLNQAIALFEESNLPQRHISNLTLSVAKGLMARVALVMGNWETAAEMASGAREGYNIMSDGAFSSGFDNHTQQNWMWGLEVNQEQSTTYASWFSHMDWTIGGYCGFGFSPKSFNRVLFDKMEDTDVRKKLIDASYVETGRLIPYKFSAGDDKEFAADLVMMRPEEMLLIEAEALFRLNSETEAKALLHQLRVRRRDVPVNSGASGEQLLEEILLERRIELWGEGFSLFDIKRLKKGIDRTNSNHNPVVARTMTLEPESPRFNFQIPQVEIDSNPAIGESNQNP